MTSTQQHAQDELDNLIALRENWAENQATYLERRAQSLEELLPGWEVKRHEDAYLMCIKICAKAEAYREIARELRLPKEMRLERKELACP
jgi:hypothetical protein